MVSTQPKHLTSHKSYSRWMSSSSTFWLVNAKPFTKAKMKFHQLIVLQKHWWWSTELLLMTILRNTTYCLLATHLFKSLQLSTSERANRKITIRCENFSNSQKATYVVIVDEMVQLNQTRTHSTRRTSANASNYSSRKQRMRRKG